MIFGHQKIRDQLYHAIETDRIVGAYLFVGMPNVGKETVALNFAQSINCADYQTDGAEKRGACQQCLSCRKMVGGNHPDFEIIRPDRTSIKIDQIRQVQSRIVFRPIEGKRKIYLFTEAERMNLEAANCLLKTLEEPPAESTLILIANNIEALLPTIRSRCQILHLQPMAIADLAQILVQQFGLSHDRAVAISANSQGAIGRALTLFQDGQHTEIDQIPEILTTTDRLSAFRIAEALSQEPERLDALLTWYRDLLMLHQQVDPQLLIHAHHLEKLQQIVRHYSRRHLQSAIETIFDTKSRIAHNVNATLAIEVMVFNLLPRVKSS